MVTVKVQAEGGRFSTVIYNDRIDYTFVGQQFEAGEPINGRFTGEVLAHADATDWRQKLHKAGLEVA